jgi:hypothetical protein
MYKKMLILFSVFMLFASSSVFAGTKVRYENQDITAYSEPAGATTHSGKDAEVGMAAVHWISQDNRPLVPFGTQVVLDTSVGHNQYGEMNSFIVEDTGDEGWKWSYAFVDLYWGDCETCSLTDDYWDQKDEAWEQGTHKDSWTGYIP